MTSVGSFVVYELSGLSTAPRQDQPAHEQPTGDELQQGPLRMNETQFYQIFDKSIVITSFAWDPNNQDRICLTTATGHVSIVDVSRTSGNASPAAVTVCCHSLEAWITSFAPRGFPFQGIFSGGDDAALEWSSSISWPVERTRSFREGDTITPAHSIHWRNSKIHTAGVTALLPLSLGPKESDNVLLTGSYDDHIRVLALPMGPGSKPEVLAELNLGGGVWRMKVVEVLDQREARDGAPIIDEIHRIRLLVCCMYAGARVVEISKVSTRYCPAADQEHRQDILSQEASWQIENLAHFEDHQSMCYGGDILRSHQEHWKGRQTDSAHRFVTCSFYDERLCFWKFSMSNG